MINKIHPTDTWHDVLYAIVDENYDPHIEYEKSYCIYPFYFDRFGAEHQNQVGYALFILDMQTEIGFLIDNDTMDINFFGPYENGFYKKILSDKKECLEEYRRLVDG